MNRNRIRSIDLLLEHHPHWRGRFTFVQVAVPTRSKLPAYSHLEAEAVALAQEVNARHGPDGYQPIRLVVRHHDPDEVFELFRAADLCIVSSLHDGMNLVAKEFVASRDDEQGVLDVELHQRCAGPFGSADRQPLQGAPMAEVLNLGLQMPAQVQRERMRLMRQQVREQNVYRWAGRMLIDAARLRQRLRILDMTSA